nr:type II secretion system protein [Agromyces seonyuensis]
MRGILARRLQGERGISLVELLVAVGILAIVLTMAVNLYISTTKTTQQSRDIHEATGNASNLVNQLGTIVRFASPLAKSGSITPDPPFLAANASGFTVTSLVDVDAYAPIDVRPAKPTRVQVSVNASRDVEERRWAAIAAGNYWVFNTASTTPTVRNLGGVLTPTGATAVFKYYDGTTLLTPPAGGNLTAAQLAVIDAVEITVAVVPNGRPSAKPVVISSVVKLANPGEN